MYLAAYNILEDHDGSMDVIQDVFIWIWQKRMDLNIITLKSYLNSAVKHKGDTKSTIAAEETAISAVKEALKEGKFVGSVMETTVTYFEASLAELKKSHKCLF